MSNEIHCTILGYGPVQPLANFVTGFRRAEFLADVPIPGRKEDDREQRTEAHGTRFMYPKPGLVWQEVDAIQETLQDIQREGYERYVPPAHADAKQMFSATFTCPCDPPAIWLMQVVEKYYHSGVRFMLHWQDLDNYWRCVECGAFDGFCTRVGAYWSVDAGPDLRYPHVASWYGRNPCKCQRKNDRRTIWDGSNDDPDYDPALREICSITAIHEGNDVIRIVSSRPTGVQTVTRQKVVGSDAAHMVIELNQARMSGSCHTMPPNTAESR